MRVNKNYYKFSFGTYCGVFVNEKTMRKISALQAKTYDSLMQILANDEDIHVENWSIADEPKELDQSQRVFRYADEEELEARLNIMRELFKIEKINNLYFVDGKYTESRKKAEQEHTDFLKSISPRLTNGTKEE